MSGLLSRLRAKLVTFIHLKTEFHCPYFLALFTNVTVLAAMLPIMSKLNVILGSECVSTWEFWYSLEKELKMMMFLPLQNILYSAITSLILNISQFSSLKIL